MTVKKTGKAEAARPRRQRGSRSSGIKGGSPSPARPTRCTPPDDHRRMELFYRTLADKSQAGAYIIQDKKFVYLNSIAIRFTGYAPKELMGKDNLICVHPDDRALMAENLRKALSQEYPSPYMYRIVTKKGVTKWIIETIAPIEYDGRPALLGNAMDVTRLQEARQRLEEMETLEASILDAIPHAVIGMADRRIIFANHAVETVFGWKPEELIGKTSRILYRSDEEYEEIGRRFYDIRGTQKRHSEEFICRKKNGADIICVMNASIIEERIRERKIVVIYEDVTERKKAGEKLLEYHEKLRTLASELSLTEERERQRIATDLHDGISQTMAAVKLKLEALRGGAASAGLREPLKELIEYMDRLIRETRSLTLDLSPPVLYILGIEAALEWLAEQFQEKHGLSVELAVTPIGAAVDRDISFFLFRSAQELLTNVVKHANVSEALITLERDGDSLLLSVEDNGKGFDRRELSFSMDRTGGFGLFSIRERLEYLGGQFSIESKKKAGTRVTMIVPLAWEGRKEKGRANHDHHHTARR